MDMFIHECEEALCNGELDFAIHRGKDMPNKLKEGCGIIGCLKREDPRDVLITRKGTQYHKQDSFIIGAGSLRRKMQLRNFYPNATVHEISGNVNEKLDKLMSGDYDAIVMAVAGLKCLGLWADEIYNYQYFSCDAFVPACGQGIIAIEGRKQDSLNQYIKEITHEKSMKCLEAEREVLGLLEVGCHDPIGVYALVIGTTMSLRMMNDNNGRVNISSVTGNAFEGKELARKLVVG